MNKIEYFGTTFSPITIPKFDGIAAPKLRFTHDIDRLSAKSINISVTVFLTLNEIGGNSKFEIFNATSKFLVDIINELTVDDLFYIWTQSANYLTKEYNRFEISQNLRPITIHIPNKQELTPYLTNIIAWFYSP